MLKKELPCSDNRELNCRQYSVIQSLGIFFGFIKSKCNAVFLGMT